MCDELTPLAIVSVVWDGRRMRFSIGDVLFDKLLASHWDGLTQADTYPGLLIEVWSEHEHEDTLFVWGVPRKFYYPNEGRSVSDFLIIKDLRILRVGDEVRILGIAPDVMLERIKQSVDSGRGLLDP